MKAHSGKFKLRSLAFFFLIAMVLTACSSSTPASRSSEPALDPAIQPQAGSHPPIILQVVDREDVVDGYQYTYSDIYFNDLDGDAVALTYREVSSSLSYPLPLTDDPIEASMEQQKGEALVSVGGRCRQKMELVIESRIRDRAGNLSEPVTFRISCLTPPVVDTSAALVSGLSIAFALALILVLGFWLLFRKHPGERLPALQSVLLLFCLFLWMTFIQKILHEGGHALYTLIRGVPSLLYVHPFNFSGYSRPIIDASIWKDISGSVSALSFSLLISLPFWKHRSPAFLPLAMLFPYVLIYDGINVLGLMGDFRTLVETNGISPIPFLFLGALTVTAGIALLFRLLPQIGLDPKDKKALFVLPAAMFLAGVLSFLVACIFVPGSPIDREYFLGREIVSTASMSLPAQTIGWAVFAVLYVTFFRRVFPRLPAWLQTGTVQLAWRDLRLPVVLATLSVILGLIIIT